MLFRRFQIALLADLEHAPVRIAQHAAVAVRLGESAREEAELVCAWAIGCAALAQTPGEIADPGSYRGSMALQAQEQAQSAQIQQQNQAMLNRLDQSYAGYAPRGGGRSGAPPLQQKPLLPAAKNPLLTGLWRMGPTRRANLGSALGSLPGAQGQANDMMSAGCSVFLADPKRDGTPRLISARRATRRERRTYEG